MAGPPPSGSDLSDRSFARILLIKPSSLGDLVHALPVLHGLRTRYPDAVIDWLVATPFAPLLAAHDETTGLILFDRKRFGAVGRSPRVTAAFVRFVQELRRRRYQMVIDLQGLFRTGFLTWATGAPVRIGFRNAREGASLFYSHHISVDDPDTHAVERNYRVAGLLGFADLPIEFRLPLPDSIDRRVRTLLARRGLAAHERLVAVVPGARWETKVWLPERFAETIDLLHSHAGLRCALIGSSDQVPLCDRIARSCRSTPLNLAGATDPVQLAAVIRLADLVLGHDSAAMHLAVAFHRPLVCLIGPTNPRRTGPFRCTDGVVRLQLDCAPCYFRRLSQCPHDHRCMKDLSVDTVVKAVERSLASPAGQRHPPPVRMSGSSCR